MTAPTPEKAAPIPADVLPHVYVAGAAEKDGKLVTSGGRVLARALDVASSAACEAALGEAAAHFGELRRFRLDLHPRLGRRGTGGRIALAPVDFNHAHAA